MPRMDNHKSDIVSKLRGIHLFHYDIAPCAQRVRFVLAEKGLTRNSDIKFDDTQPATLCAPAGTWNSRIVSLFKKEHFSETYAAIQPNLVIPALVHDGVLYTESMDIVEYLDTVLPGDRLTPTDDDPRYEDMRYLTELGKKLHWSIRHVTYRWGGAGKLNPQEQRHIEALLKKGSDGENLAKFYRDFSSDLIPQEVYDEHVRALGRGFEELSSRLEDGRQFLTGDTLTIADAIWAMKIIRLEEMAYPTATLYPAVSEWFGRIEARPSFATLVGDYSGLRRVLKAKAWIDKTLDIGLPKTARELANVA